MDNPHFTEERLKEIFEAVHEARKLGILTEGIKIKENFVTEKPVKIKENSSGSTTSSSLLYDERPPRADVKAKLRDIAELLPIQSEFFPYFKPKVLKKFIRVIIGNADDRTVKKYLKCITDNSEKDPIRGLYDVRGFCTQALK